ncbi:hypothetical protein Tsubulata_031075 [Turnera subulata]|uniref:Vacuolar ATPase assembly integral membrane protein VMA21 homolog n=1 Tax=Turnera subulata TaxID=218843 RepID=A0A9Q0FSA5_9ROSI|nr:hypothetical protein Tsubulata_031075 [Turnera subulata]
MGKEPKLKLTVSTQVSVVRYFRRLRVPPPHRSCLPQDPSKQTRPGEAQPPSGDPSDRASFCDSIRVGKPAMKGVIQKFVIASMFMWIIPVAILYAFNHNLLPGVTHLSPYSLTLLSGFLAVISVNIVIAFYIYMAMKEPTDKHEPDAAFVDEAKASVSQLTGKVENSTESLKKEE